MCVSFRRMASPSQPERPNDVDTSPLFLWAAVLVGLVVTALVAARFLGKL